MKKYIFVFIMFFGAALQAETFKFHTLDNHTVEISYNDGVLTGKIDGRRQAIVLDLFGVTCGPCAAKVPELNAAYEDGEYVIGVETFFSESDKLKNFALKHSVKYPLVSSYEREPQLFLRFLQEKGLYKGFVPVVLQIDEDGLYL